MSKRILILFLLTLNSGCAHKVTGTPEYMTAYNNCNGVGQKTVYDHCVGMPDAAYFICNMQLRNARSDADAACMQRAGFSGLDGQ